MKATTKLVLTAAAAFAGGYAAGLLTAPQSGSRLRRVVARQVGVPTRWVEARFHEIERQLVTLEHQLMATSADLSERLREATHRAVDFYVPSMPEAASNWEVKDTEVTGDLRRMPHG